MFIALILLLLFKNAILINNEPYSFYLDQQFGPSWYVTSIKLFGFETPYYGGSLPLYMALSLVVGAFGAGALQKFILTGVLFLCALVPYILFSRDERGGFYVALLFLINPFIYGRFLAGHWIVLWGLDLLPVVLKAFIGYLEKGGYRDLFFVVLAIFLLGFSSHLLLASGVLLFILLVFRYLETGNPSTVKKGIFPLLLFIPLNVYWLGPVLLSEGGRVSSISSLDIPAFAPSTDIFNALYSVASMHGFWRGGYIYAKDIAPWTEYFFLVILFLAVHGFISNYRDPERGYVVKTMGATAVVAVLLGAGASGPAAPLFGWMFHNVPFFRGMRDSQKFVALLVLAYAYLGGLGVQEFAEDLGSRTKMKGTLRRLWGRGLVEGDGRRLLSLGVVALALVTPVIYTFPMLTGFAGQVQPTDYPDEWYEVNDFLEGNAAPQEQALFLPWHQYMAFDWVPNRDPTIANPAKHFFSTPVVQGDNVQIGGIYSQSGKPSSRYVEFLFGLGPDNERKNVSNVGELLVPLNVKYVLVTKEVDWERYDEFLQKQDDLELVLENDMFRVYENTHDVSRSYGVDEVRFVSGWSEFLNRSRSEDVTEAAYVVNGSRAGENVSLGTGGREVLETEEVHPAKYRVEGSEEALTVFTQRQDTSYSHWSLDGRVPRYQMLGFVPVFESVPGGEFGTLRYERFYWVYLPSYVVSFVTFIVLVVFYFRPGWWRRLSGFGARKT